MFSRKAKKTASNAPRVTDDDEELPSGEQHSRVVQPIAAERSSSSPTGVADEACERSASTSSSSASGGVDAARANSASATTPAAAVGDDAAGASSSPTGVTDEAFVEPSSSASGGVDAARANSASATTTPAAVGGEVLQQGSPSPLGRALRQCKKYSRARKPAAPPSGSS